MWRDRQDKSESNAPVGLRPDESARAGIRLEVTSGLHEGIDRLLSPGTYHIGRSESCDFVLADEALESLAFTLDVGPRTALLTAEQALGLEGSDDTLLLQPGKQVPVPLPGKVQIGEVTIALTSTETAPAAVTWASRNPAVAGFIAVSLLAVGVFIAARANLPVNEPEPVAAEQKLEELLAERGLGERVKVVSVDGNDDKSWALQGRVARRAQIDELNAAIQASDMDVRLDIVDDGTVRRNVETVISASPGRLVAEMDRDGGVVVKGIISDDVALRRLQQALEADVAGLENLTFEVETHRDILNAVRAQLEARGLAGKVDLSLREQTLFAGGRLREFEQELWREVKIWYDPRYEGVLPILAKFEPVSTRGPDIEIRAIWTGDEPYVIAGNGSKYRTGAILPGGWRVQEIHTDRVVLGYNGALVELRM